MKIVVAALALLSSLASRGAENAFEIRPVVETGELVQFAKPTTGEERGLHLGKTAALDSRHIATTSVQTDPVSKQPELLVKLTPDGAERFAKVTKENVRKRLAIVVNKKIIMAPVIQQSIAGGSFVISGNFSEAELGELAKTLSPK